MYVVHYVYKKIFVYHNIQCIENLFADKNQDGELSASELTSPAEKAFKVLDQNLSLKIMELNTKQCQWHNGPDNFWVLLLNRRLLSLSLNGVFQLQISAKWRNRHKLSAAYML